MFFFFNDTATTEIYTLSLHDALPIFGQGRGRDPAALRARAPEAQSLRRGGSGVRGSGRDGEGGRRPLFGAARPHRFCERSEEHTSELQSQSNLVCRLLLEKKKTHPHIRLCRLALLLQTLCGREVLARVAVHVPVAPYIASVSVCTVVLRLCCQQGDHDIAG